MFMANAAMRWQAVWLDLLVVAVTFIVSGLIIALNRSIAPSDAGMALAFALQVSKSRTSRASARWYEDRQLSFLFR